MFSLSSPKQKISFENLKILAKENLTLIFKQENTKTFMDVYNKLKWERERDKDVC